MITPKSTSLRLPSSLPFQAIQVQFKLTSQQLWGKMVDPWGSCWGHWVYTKPSGDIRDLVRRTCVIFTVAIPGLAQSPIVKLQCLRLWREKAPPQSHTQEFKHPSVCKDGGKTILWVNWGYKRYLLIRPFPPCFALKCSRKRPRENMSQGVTSFPSQMHHGSHPSTLLHAIIFGLWVWSLV